jgi:hypothetical protein
VSSSAELCPHGHVEGSKPYVDASRAAALLGTTRAAIVADVQAGCGAEEQTGGKIECLRGAAMPSGICVVAASDLEGERLERHRERFAKRQGAQA